MKEAVSVGAAVVPTRKSNAAWSRLVMAIFISVVAVSLVGVAAPTSVEASRHSYRHYAFPAGTAHRGSQAARILALAKRQTGKRYVFGATGMRAFDCSGFVYRVYKMAGLVNRIGGRRMGATGYWNWFRRHHAASRSNPRPGDLIIYLRGRHIGVYIGDGMAIDSVPHRGVGVRRVWTERTRKHFTTYLHVRISH